MSEAAISDGQQCCGKKEHHSAGQPLGFQKVSKCAFSFAINTNYTCTSSAPNICRGRRSCCSAALGAQCHHDQETISWNASTPLLLPLPATTKDCARCQSGCPSRLKILLIIIFVNRMSVTFYLSLILFELVRVVCPLSTGDPALLPQRLPLTCRLVLSASIEKLLFTHSFTFGHTIYAIISLFCGISVFAFVQSDFGMSVATATSGGVPVNAACRRISPKENASQVSGECIQE